MAVVVAEAVIMAMVMAMLTVIGYPTAAARTYRCVLDGPKRVHHEIVVGARDVADPGGAWDIGENPNQLALLGELDYLVRLPVRYEDPVVVREDPVRGL